MKCRSNHAWTDCTCGPEEGDRTSRRSLAAAFFAVAVVIAVLFVVVS